MNILKLNRRYSKRIRNIIKSKRLHLGKFADSVVLYSWTPGYSRRDDRFVHRLLLAGMVTEQHQPPPTHVGNAQGAGMKDEDYFDVCPICGYDLWVDGDTGDEFCMHCGAVESRGGDGDEWEPVFSDDDAARPARRAAKAKE